MATLALLFIFCLEYLKAGPLLFLIYINNLPNSSKLLRFLFADDTTLLDSDIDITALISRVNIEFRKVVYYFRAYKPALTMIKPN